tara:strand:- start:3456 stop:3983 length:528 start_codon:yes stop_codon:yes gene_type:complete
MTKATDGFCDLQVIEKCKIIIPGATPIIINNLPDISDTKSAAYNDEAVIGRAVPLKTYSHSENRVINTKIHFFIRKAEDGEFNLRQLRAIQSAVYPQTGDPYKPPPVCQLECGDLLSLEKPLCVILLSYNVTFPTDVAWHKETYCPYKFDVDCSWQVVYANVGLPTSSRIFTSGR